jgi:uncharacterized membrane protein YccF (DUF307 family)
MEPAMPLISVLLNLLWVVTGGIWMAILWFIAGAVMVITIIGLPWAFAAFSNGWYTLLPFGQTVIPREDYTGRRGLASTPIGFLGNLVWLLLAGWWLALGHVVTAVPLAISIIGLPFAWAHLKLAGLALWPLGKMVVTIDEADRLYYRPWRRGVL